MSAYSTDKLLIEAREAVQISRHTDAWLCFKAIYDLFYELHELIPYNERMGTRRIRMAYIASALWTAGRVHGVREERARHRKKITTVTRNIGGSENG